MMFGDQEDTPPPDPGPGKAQPTAVSRPAAPPEVKRPNLKIVK